MKETKAQLAAKVDALSIGIATFYEKLEIELEAAKRAKAAFSAYPDLCKGIDVKINVLADLLPVFNHHITQKL